MKFAPHEKHFFGKKSALPLPNTLGGGGENMKESPKIRLKAKGTS